MLLYNIKRMSTVNFFGIGIDNYSYSHAYDTIYNILKKPYTQYNHLITINPEMLIKSRYDSVFRDVLETTKLKICDGAGISILAKYLYNKHIEVIPGVEIAAMILEISSILGTRVCLLGGPNEPYYTRLLDYIQMTYPSLNLVCTYGGDRNKIYKEVIDSAPEVILCCYGMVYQDYRLLEYSALIPSLKLGGGFGGTFDFWSNRTTRAPKWMRTLCLEWLFRLFHEPCKRYKRIFTAVIVFTFNALLERLQRFFT